MSVSLLNQIMSGIIASCEVFKADIAELRSVDIGIDQHYWNMKPGNGIEEFIFENSGEEQTVHIPVLEKGNQFFCSLYSTKHEVVSVFTQSSLNGSDGGGMEGVIHHIGIGTGDNMINEPNHFGGTGYQRTGRHIRYIAQFFDGIVDALNRFGRDTFVPAVDYIRYCCCTDTGGLCNISNSNHNISFVWKV